MAWEEVPVSAESFKEDTWIGLFAHLDIFV